MDHLPFPHGVKQPTVPLVGTLYDLPAGNFARFPAQQGMKEDISTCSFVRLSPNAYQAFFQTWLYFGCLSEISNIIELPIDIACFVRRISDQECIVTSASLNAYLDQWRNRELDHHRSKKKTAGEQRRLNEILETMGNMLRGPLQAFRRFLADHHPSSPVTAAWPRVALSIAALGYSFDQASNKIYGYFSERGQRVWGVQWALRERLRGACWCKALISKFLAGESIDFALFISSTPSPHASEDHSQCTDTVCSGRMANTGTYKTAHVVKGCTCSMRDMPSPATAIVERGGIPLATWSDGEGLKVVEYQPNIPYVAISHVWSDGKGNRERNALPECQLKSIQEKVAALYAAPRADPQAEVPLFGPRKRHEPRDPRRQPRGFWMDTLCIPVGESLKHLRRKAIVQMREIYEQADRVLVLDDRVQQLSLSSPFCDRAVRVMLSNWQSRIWTLQEGIMAQQLFIQFSDGAMTLEELQEEEGRRQSGPKTGLSRAASPAFWHRVTVNVITLLSISFRFDKEEEEKKPDTFAPDQLFAAIVPVAKNRRTSWREDETICLSALLRLDSGPLLDIHFKFPWDELRAMPEEQRLAEEKRVCEGRMKLFLCMIGRFGRSIIFSELPRLSGDGFRWAPSSFLGQSGTTNFVDREEFHKCTTHNRWASILFSSDPLGSSQDLPKPEKALGLMVTYPGIMLHAASRSLPAEGTFYVRERQIRRSLYCVVLKDLPPTIEHDGNETMEYALVTLDVPTLGRNSPIPAVFGVFLGMMDNRVRKLRPISVARITVIDRIREVAKENPEGAQSCKHVSEKGEAWIDEDSDNWKSVKDEESEEDTREFRDEDLEYTISEHGEGQSYDTESGGDSENSSRNGKSREVEGSSGSDGDFQEDSDGDGDDEGEEESEDDEEDEEDEQGEDFQDDKREKEEDGGYASEKGGYDSSLGSSRMIEAHGEVKTREESDYESFYSNWEYDSEQDDLYGQQTAAGKGITRTTTIGRDVCSSQIVSGKVLFMHNNKWCIL